LKQEFALKPFFFGLTNTLFFIQFNQSTHKVKLSNSSQCLFYLIVQIFPTEVKKTPMFNYRLLLHHIALILSYSIHNCFNNLLIWCYSWHSNAPSLYCAQSKV